jgi:hypothetical protein
MSSVKSSSSTSGQDEVIRKVREEYRKKEAELVKKQSEQVRKLNEKYATEIIKKDRSNAANLSSAREKSQESLTQRDVKYRKEMEDLRAMHARQMEKFMQDNQTKLDTQRQAARSEIKQAYLGKDDRIKELHSRYEENLAEVSGNFQNRLDNIRAEQQREMGETLSKNQKAHQEELAQLLDERNETVADLKNDYRILKQNKNKQIRSQEIKHIQDQASTESAHIKNVALLGEAHNTIQEQAKIGFDESLDIIRHRMSQARERDANAQHEIASDFQDHVEDQIEGRVNRLERALEQAKSQNIAANAKRERDKNTQINNIREAYKTKFDYLEKARADALKQGQEADDKNEKKMQKNYDKLAMDTGNYYRDRMAVENYKYRSAMENLETEHALRNNYLNENSEARVDKIREDEIAKNQRLSENYQANLEIMKGANQAEKSELRLHMNREKDKAIKSIKDDAQKLEANQQRRIDDVVAKYEKRIAEMNDQNLRERRLRDNHEKAMVNTMKRQHEVEKETLRMQYEEQNRQANQMREREIQDVNKRHQEKLNEVLNTMKKS